MNDSELKAIMDFVREALTEYKNGLKEIAIEIKTLNSSVNDIRINMSKFESLSSALKDQVTDLVKRVTILENCNTAEQGEKRGRENTIKFTWLIWGGLATGILLLIVRWFSGI
jgi:predicted  nucleic acid-binding Zn-ribbon protein